MDPLFGNGFAKSPEEEEIERLRSQLNQQAERHTFMVAELSERAQEVARLQAENAELRRTLIARDTPVAWMVKGSPIYTEKCFVEKGHAEAERLDRRDTSTIVPLGEIRPAPLTAEELQRRYQDMGNQDADRQQKG